VKIRTRAFLALWLISILIAATLGFILYALYIVAPGMDAERERIAQTRSIHAALWHTLVSLEHDQHDFFNLPSITERRQQERQAVND